MLPEKQRNLPAVIGGMVDDVEENVANRIDKGTAVAGGIGDFVSKPEFVQQDERLMVIMEVYHRKCVAWPGFPHGTPNGLSQNPVIPYLVGIQYMAKQGH